MLEDFQYIAGGDGEREGLDDGEYVFRSKCVFVGSGRTQQSEGGSDSVEGIERSERRQSSLSDKIAVDEVLQLLGRLHGSIDGTGMR